MRLQDPEELAIADWLFAGGALAFGREGPAFFEFGEVGGPAAADFDARLAVANRIAGTVEVAVRAEAADEVKAARDLVAVSDRGQRDAGPRPQAPITTVFWCPRRS